MSQWGAYGQAKAGRTYKEILGHLLPRHRARRRPAAVREKVRVLVATASARSPSRPRPRSSSSTAPASATGFRVRVTVDPTLELPVGKEGTPKALAASAHPATDRGRQPRRGREDYRGKLEISRATASLQLVNTVGLEAYLLGVVPGEMPKDWPLEALKAQAVAARTYALASLVKGKPFDLYSDWRSQVYYGVDSESPGTTRAVRETRGQILTYEGKPAQTFYFSSSGGRTCSALDVFGTDFPYLVAVDDPWDETSPNHRWASQLAAAGAQLAQAVRAARAVVADATLVPGTPGEPAVVRLTTAAGGTSEVRLSDVRARLGAQVDGVPARRPPPRRAQRRASPKARSARPASRRTSTTLVLEQRGRRRARGSPPSASRPRRTGRSRLRPHRRDDHVPAHRRRARRAAPSPSGRSREPARRPRRGGGRGRARRRGSELGTRRVAGRRRRRGERGRRASRRRTAPTARVEPGATARRLRAPRRPLATGSRSHRPTRSPRSSGTRSRSGPTTPGRRCRRSRRCASR